MEQEQFDLLKSLTPQEKIHNPEGFFVHSKFWSLYQTSGQRFYAFNAETGQKLRFVKSLAIQNDQNVYLVEDAQRTRWVLKWELVGKRIPKKSAEAAEYERLEAMGAQCPRRLKGFQVLWFEVLVLEFLEPLDRDDDVLELATQLMTTQLRYIHRYACYGDLKLDNIRKRVEGKKTWYFLIDMNLSKTRQGPYGYERDTFTPIFASQLFPHYLEAIHSFDITYKVDLIELKFVLNALVCQRSYESQADAYSPKRVEESKRELGLLPEDFFADPVRMSNNPIYETKRGYLAVQKLFWFGLRNATWFLSTLKPDELPLEYDETQYVAMAESLEREGREHYDYHRKRDDKAFRKMQERQQKSAEESCRVCGDITTSKCGYCYYTITPLCIKSECRLGHDCK